MEKQQITEEMQLQKEWYEQASKIKTIEELTSFINHVLNDYQHDYGTVCHAISACALASAWLGSSQEGITGFQASFVMWGFIFNWTKKGNKCGLRLVDFDDMLYPQYRHKFEKTISKNNWEALQREATERLKNEPDACDEVAEHWKSIVNGVVPFGYSVEEGE